MSAKSDLRITLHLEYQKHQEEKVVQSNETKFRVSVHQTIFSKRSTPQLLVGLHDRVGYKGRGDLIATKPATVQTLDGFLG